MCPSKVTHLTIEKDRKAIDELIESGEQLKQLFGLLTSIPGIGTATATEII